METYDLKELGFVEALTKEQRHDVATKRGGRLSPDGRFLMRIDVNKQTITVWNSQQEQPLLTLYRNGKDWIIWTPEGYYAATPGGEKMLVWKMDHGIDKMPSVYTADRFSKKLHRPDVIKKAFELGSVEAALKELDGAKAKSAEVEALLPPKVDLGIVDQKTAPTIKVKATAVAAVKGQPVTTLRLMLDGRPLSDPKMTLRFDPGQDKVEAEFTVTIPEGKHTLTAFARSPDASNASEPLTVHHVIKANLPSMHVLAIGINEHKDVSLKLNCAKNDAQAIAKTFKAASKGNLFREVHTEEILDQQATRAYILTKVEELRQRTAKSPNDLAVIFFAGHGIKKKDAFYLLTHEADLDKLEGSSLSGDDLRKALGEFPCQVLLMLDACNSAGFGQGKKLSKLGLRPATDDVSRSLTDNDIGVAVFCAAMGHEKAKEEQGNGLFTRAVMDALTKLDEVPFNKVNRLQYLHHVHSHVFDLVSAWSEEKQHPFLNLPWTTESRALRELPKK